MYKKLLKTHLASLVYEKKALTRTRTRFLAWARSTDKEATPPNALFTLDRRRGEVKTDIRHHHLALGLLRGRGYREMEHKTREGNAPRADAIQAALRTFLPFQVQRQGREWVHIPVFQDTRYTPEYITSWLEASSEALQEAAE